MLHSPMFSASRLLQDLTEWSRKVMREHNNLASGRVSATLSGTASPTTGDYNQGDFVRNSAPTELGTAGSKHVITGWLCVASGTPGTWVECRSLTGA